MTGNRPEEDEVDEALRERFRATAPFAPPLDVDALFAMAGRRAAESPRLGWWSGPRFDWFGSQDPFPDRRLAMTLKISLGALIAASVAALFLVSSPRGSAASFGLGDVQRGVDGMQSVAFRSVERRPGQPDRVTRVTILAPSRVRAESDDGYAVSDLRRREALLVDTRRKTARSLRGLDFPSGSRPESLFEMVRTLPEKAEQTLPERTIAGKKAVGFVVRQNGQRVTVWADPATKLPVRLEQASGDREEPRYVADEFLFGGQPDESLFRLEPPEGYPVETIGVDELRPVSGDAALAAPLVTPLVGIGPARFGMSRGEVIRLLGAPDKAVAQGPVELLEYYSRGYSLMVSPQRGLLMISCLSPGSIAVQVRQFRGKTDRGIALGATRAEILKAYGPPDREDADQKAGKGALYYDKIGVFFVVSKGQLSLITLKAPPACPPQAAKGETKPG